MPLNLRQSKKQRSFDLPVSYKINEQGEKLRDALNVFSSQGRLETRYGRSRYNDTGLGDSVTSLSFFKNASGQRFLIAKVGTELISVKATGAHTVLKTGLTSGVKHRGITWARGISSRHIISCGADGLFQFDGTNFSELGTNGPAAPSIATASGSLTGTFSVYLTFYSSSTGFESNAGPESVEISPSSQGLGLSAIPTTCNNATIDKIRIYLKDSASVDDAIFAGEIDLGTTTFEINAAPTSTESHPLANGKPLSGGGKFLTEFNRKLVYAGNGTFKNDVFFSEEDLPDAFNDGKAPGRLVLSPIYDGEITGLATGLYSNSVLDPFLVIFKERSIHVYSEIGGDGKLIPISAEIGCVSHDTIKVKNGVVFFLSTSGWRVIENGRLINDKNDNAATLGIGDVDDIFTSPGYIYEINKTRLNDAFSVYYSELDQYFTWVCEGAENEFKKTYVYEYKSRGFKPYQFHNASTCACIGENQSGREAVFMGDANGYLYTHSISEARSDDDELGEDQNISAFAVMTWMDGDDLDATFSFREVMLRRIAGAGDITVKTWVNYSLDEVSEFSQVISNPLKGFVLDLSKLDIDSFGSDERTLIKSRADINRTGENILIGFYQDSQGESIGLVSAQIDFNKNGNSSL